MKDLIPVSDLEKMALAITNSKLFGIQSKDQAIALMLIAQSEGLHPAVAARDYHIIQGRPALKADAILSRFQESGGCVSWKKYTDTEVSGIFSHPKGGEVEINWSIQMANSAGLTGNPTWKKYPRQMLRARCISEGVRTVYPAVTHGMYTEEEVESIEPKYKVIQEPTELEKKQIAKPQKEELTPNHQKWNGAVQAFRNGNVTIEAIRNTYELSDVNAELLGKSLEEAA